MIERITLLLGKKFSSDYNCLDFVKEALDFELPHVSHRYAVNHKITDHAFITLFEETEKEDFSLVVFDHHIGVWFNGGMFHLEDEVQWTSDTSKYNNPRYFRRRK